MVVHLPLAPEIPRLRIYSSRGDLLSSMVQIDFLLEQSSLPLRVREVGIAALFGRL